MANNQNAQHLSLSNEHYTPSEITSAYKQLIEKAIDLDPFSCEKANETVQAVNYYSLEKQQNGFIKDWFGSVFCNSPGGFVHPLDFVPTKRGASSMASAFDKAEAEYLSGRAEQILFVAFSMELISKRPNVLNYPLCFINKNGKEKHPHIITGGGRLRYTDANGTLQKSPTHSTFLIYFPLRFNSEGDMDTDKYIDFLDIFGQFGATGFFS